MKLHLGVINIPYENENTTTGDVAERLETKYHIMQTFFDRYGDEIAQLMSNDLAAGLENLMMGAPLPADPFAESMSQVHHLFSAFLYNKEMNGLTGIPTQRALDGISKRFKNGKGPKNRPSFIDTGMFENSMRAWVSGVLNAFHQ
ncbi:hypothetical protein M942_22590 [Enterobacter ludwigii]|jgi:hypothetical protein|uniref:hypothetical protein n=1 Tax=Enterobacter ludwigii TaxID=299767 RepID=UPI0003D933C6|nr:hypothetical protein [Enterobacter ludwigii]AHE73407.1 hypothetical protein M942_22590 [Enterobacter ludwigii]